MIFCPCKDTEIRFPGASQKTTDLLRQQQYVLKRKAHGKAHRQRSLELVHKSGEGRVQILGKWVRDLLQEINRQWVQLDAYQRLKRWDLEWRMRQPWLQWVQVEAKPKKDHPK